MLLEYDISQDTIILYCNNMSVINISKISVPYSRTKHIDIRHHFILELVETKEISLEHGLSSIQLADIMTKLLKVNLFEKLRARLGVFHFNK